MALLTLLALFQDAPAADTGGGTQNMIRIGAGVLALVLVVIIIMRRKGSKKKEEEEF
jgi:high-affinity Fe2+/Pb2+ permease